MIGLIIAMDKELLPYLNENTQKKTIGGKDFYEFEIHGKACVAVKSGIGKVNAAYATTLLIENYRPKFIVSTGISGGLGRCKLLDVVVAVSCVQYDVDTTALGDEIGFVSTVNKVYFETNTEIADAFCRDTDAKKVILASGDRFIADVESARFIVETFDASACDMESGAIAQIAYITHTPFIAVRCISDGADGEAAPCYEKLTDSASIKLAEFVKKGINKAV